MSSWSPITKVKRKQLSRKVATKAFGKASPYHVGQAGKTIDKLLEDDISKYIEFHEKYCTPHDDVIIEDAVKELSPQGSLF